MTSWILRPAFFFLNSASYVMGYLSCKLACINYHFTVERLRLTSHCILDLTNKLFPIRLPLRAPIDRSLMKKLYGRPSYSSRVWTFCTSSCVSTTTVRSWPSFRPMTGESYCCARWSSARCKYLFSRHSFLRYTALPTIGSHGGPRASSWRNQGSRPL